MKAGKGTKLRALHQFDTRAVARYSLLDRCAVWKGSFIILSGHKTKFRQYLPIRLQGLLQRTDGIPENVPLSSLFFIPISSTHR